MFCIRLMIVAILVFKFSYSGLTRGCWGLRFRLIHIFIWIYNPSYLRFRLKANNWCFRCLLIPSWYILWGINYFEMMEKITWVETRSLNELMGRNEDRVARLVPTPYSNCLYVSNYIIIISRDFIKNIDQFDWDLVICSPFCSVIICSWSLVYH